MRIYYDYFRKNEVAESDVEESDDETSHPAQVQNTDSQKAGTGTGTAVMTANNTHGKSKESILRFFTKANVLTDSPKEAFRPTLSTESQKDSNNKRGQAAYQKLFEESMKGLESLKLEKELYGVGAKTHKDSSMPTGQLSKQEMLLKYQEEPEKCKPALKNHKAGVAEVHKQCIYSSQNPASRGGQCLECGQSRQIATTSTGGHLSRDLPASIIPRNKDANVDESTSNPVPGTAAEDFRKAMATRPENYLYTTTRNQPMSRSRAALPAANMEAKKDAFELVKKPKEESRELVEKPEEEEDWDMVDDSVVGGGRTSAKAQSAPNGQSALMNGNTKGKGMFGGWF